MEPVEVYYQVVRDKHRSQEALNSEYGTKTGTMLAFGSALIGGAGIILNVARPAGEWPFFFFALLLGFFLLTVMAASQVIWLRQWRNGPQGPDLANRLDAISGNADLNEEFMRVVSDSFSVSTEENGKVLKRKSLAMDLTIVGLLLEVAVFGAFAVSTYLE